MNAPKSDASRSLLIGCGGAAALLVLLLALVPYIGGTPNATSARMRSCANNLSQLLKMQGIYATRFGGPERTLPAEVGPAFWLALSRTSPPLIHESNFDIYLCPFAEQEPAPGRITYRGPAKPAAELGPDDVLGCCAPGLHPDGSIAVVLMNGAVHLVDADDPLYARALAETLGSEAR